MLRNFLRIAFRNLFRHRGFTLINIAGLSIGIAVSILLVLWIQSHLLFDHHHEKLDRIACLLVGVEISGEMYLRHITPYAILPIIVDEYPEIEDGTRLRSIDDVTIRVKGQGFNESSIALTEPGFFRIFDIPVLRGDPESALEDVRSIVISRSCAEKLFGENDPMEQVIHVEFDDLNSGLVQGEFTVRAIVDDMPSNSSLDFDYILPMEVLGKENLSKWTYETQAYVLLHQGEELDMVESKIEKAIERYSPREYEIGAVLHLQEFSQIHLHKPDGTPSESLIYIFIFGAAGLVILSIACINYLNLSMARAFTRIREVGIRKIVGANRAQLWMQFMLEALIIVSLAIVISIILVEIMLPGFNLLMRDEIKLEWGNRLLWLSLPLLVLAVSFLSGFLPAMYLSEFNPVSTKYYHTSGSSRQLLRKTLVVFQFFVTITLLTTAFIIVKQFRFMLAKDPGFNPDAVLSIAFNHQYGDKYEILREKLLVNPGVLAVTHVSDSPYQIMFGNPVFWEGKEGDTDLYFKFLMTDDGIIDALGLDLIAGRNFNEMNYLQSDNLSDDGHDFILNERAVTLMNLENPIGYSLRLHRFNGTIIGIVKDFENSLPGGGASPLVIWQNAIFCKSLLIKIAPESRAQTFDYVKETFARLFPDIPFEYDLLPDMIESSYGYFSYIKNVVVWFALLSILLSFIGLYGLNVFITEQRTREIGIRKVIGATSSDISIRLLKDFLGLIVIAALPAIPVAWYFSGKFIGMFYYRIPINWLHFAIPFTVIVVFAVATMLYRILQVSRIKPVDSLRTD